LMFCGVVHLRVSGRCGFVFFACALGMGVAVFA
jgi:hypothetical protein